MKLRIRDILFMVLWSVATILIGVGGVCTLLTRRWSQNLAIFWARVTLWLLKHISGISTHVRGYTNISDKPVIYAVKHQSSLDTFALWMALPRPAFVLRRTLYKIPFFGWYLWRSGQIGINRNGGRSAMESMIKQARKHAEAGRPIVIFPEGTRRAPGAITRYKVGVAYMSEALELPVVPVALNAGRFWPKRLVRKRSGHAVVEFLPAMPPAGTAKEAWMDDLISRIETASTKLLEQE